MADQNWESKNGVCIALVRFLRFNIFGYVSYQSLLVCVELRKYVRLCVLLSKPFYCIVNLMEGIKVKTHRSKGYDTLEL